MCWILPSGPITNVVRAIPITLLAVHIFFLHDAISVGDFLVGIGEQRKGQLEFVLKLLLCLGRVGGDPEQDGAGFLNLLVGIAEGAGFDGASGSIGAGIEIQNHCFASQALEREFLSVLVLQSKLGALSLIFMRVSFPGKSGLKAASGVLALEKPRPGRIVSRKSLYRRLGHFVIALMFFLAPAAIVRSLAQERRPPRISPEKSPSQENKKPKKGERAASVWGFCSSTAKARRRWFRWRS
jgi:hypothetical protein